MLRPGASRLAVHVRRGRRLLVVSNPLVFSSSSIISSRNISSSSRVLISTSTPAFNNKSNAIRNNANNNKNNKNNNNESSLFDREDHERRVAAAQALVLEQQQLRRRPWPGKSTSGAVITVTSNTPTITTTAPALDHVPATTTTATATTTVAAANDDDDDDDDDNTLISAATSSNNDSSLSPLHLHTVANNIQHWCSKDPAFFHATMEALNLSGLTLHSSNSNSNSNNNINQKGSSSSQQQQQQHQNQNHHPLSVLVNQYRQLYYASIADFRNFIVETTESSSSLSSSSSSSSSLPASLQQVFQQLVQAGFGDPLWSKRYRQVRGYESRKYQMERTIAKLQQEELERRQGLVQSAEHELSALMVAARRSALEQKQRQILKQQQQNEQKQQQQQQSWDDIFQNKSSKADSAERQPPSMWSQFTSWFSSLSLPSSSSSPTTSNIQQPEFEKQPPVVSSLDDDSHERNDDEVLRIYMDPFAPPSNRIQKRLRAKIQAIQFLHRDVQDTQEEIRQLQSNLETLRFPLPVHEYDRARQAILEAREVLCQELATQIRERHAQLIEQYQRLDAKTDLTKPQEWFSYARLDRRKIIFHSGPTNSGKTYNALERLKEAERGLYLGPLRLLAAEVYENLTSDGIYANLFTGQERREIAFSTHAAATVEMVDLNKEYDVVVIDEIQMISDVTRGAAWTKALLGLRCKEIHVCGGSEAQTIVKKLADSCGDDFELKEYERFSPLLLASKSMADDPTKAGCYRHVQPGDCVVAFSRNDIFAIKREIEKTTGYRCCVIYGKLPPQTRADQARRFNDPDSGYDILVASDAIGMGLNLNIKRIIFNSIFKYNGEEAVRLSHSEIKQISGRAGRRNSPYPHGEVTCRDPRDLPYIRKCMSAEIEQIEKAALLPTSAHIELFSEGLQAYDVGDDATDLHNLLRQFSAMATVKGDYFLGRQTEMQSIAKQLKGIPLSLKDAYTMCLSPTSENSMYLLHNFARKLARGEVCGLPSRSVPKAAKSFDDLSYLCNIYGDADLFLWLQYKYPPSNAVEHQAALARKETTLEFINLALANTDKLDLHHDYIKTAIRHRTQWESENGPAYMDDFLENSSSQHDRTFEEEEEDDDDDGYASFAENRQAHG